MRTVTKALLAALLALAPAAAPCAEFVVVAHPSVEASSVSRADLGRMFLRFQTEWPGGGHVRPVDQAKSSAVRESFSREVLGRTLSALEQFWTQSIFSGRAVPPVEKRTDSEVLAYVRDTPGAVGYVSAAASAEGVKKLAVKD
jgi:ABC-type phosphate transport system substrate-binding protein